MCHLSYRRGRIQHIVEADFFVVGRRASIASDARFFQSRSIAATELFAADNR